MKLYLPEDKDLDQILEREEFILSLVEFTDSAIGGGDEAEKRDSISILTNYKNDLIGTWSDNCHSDTSWVEGILDVAIALIEGDDTKSKLLIETVSKTHEDSYAWPAILNPSKDLGKRDACVHIVGTSTDGKGQSRDSNVSRLYFEYYPSSTSDGALRVLVHPSERWARMVDSGVGNTTTRGPAEKDFVDTVKSAVSRAFKPKGLSGVVIWSIVHMKDPKQLAFKGRLHGESHGGAALYAAVCLSHGIQCDTYVYVLAKLSAERNGGNLFERVGHIPQKIEAVVNTIDVHFPHVIGQIRFYIPDSRQAVTRFTYAKTELHRWHQFSYSNYRNLDDVRNFVGSAPKASIGTGQATEHLEPTEGPALSTINESLGFHEERRRILGGLSTIQHQPEYLDNTHFPYRAHSRKSRRKMEELQRRAKSDFESEAKKKLQEVVTRGKSANKNGQGFESVKAYIHAISILNESDENKVVANILYEFQRASEGMWFSKDRPTDNELCAIAQEAISELEDLINDLSSDSHNTARASAHLVLAQTFCYKAYVAPNSSAASIESAIGHFRKAQIVYDAEKAQDTWAALEGVIAFSSFYLLGFFAGKEAGSALDRGFTSMRLMLATSAQHSKASESSAFSQVKHNWNSAIALKLKALSGAEFKDTLRTELRLSNQVTGNFPAWYILRLVAGTRIRSDMADISFEKVIAGLESPWSDYECGLCLYEKSLIMAGREAYELLLKAKTKLESTSQMISADRRVGRWLYTRVNLALVNREIARVSGHVDKLNMLTTLNLELDKLIAHEAVTHMPVLGAFIRNTLGLIQCDLSYLMQADGRSFFDEAKRNLEEALEIRQRAFLPHDWAETQNNLAACRILWASLVLGDERMALLKSARELSESSLEILDLDVMPLQWAQAQNNLAGVYLLLAENCPRQEAHALCKDAYDICQSIRNKFAKESFPRIWARVSNNLSLALFGQSACGDSNQRDGLLEQARQTMLDALEILDGYESPVLWRDRIIWCSQIYAEARRLVADTSLSLGLSRFLEITTFAYGDLPPTLYLTAGLLPTLPAVYLVRAKEKPSNDDAWYYIEVDDPSQIPFFLEKVKTGLDLTQFGKVLYSGWGNEPPTEIKDKIKAEFG